MLFEATKIVLNECKFRFISELVNDLFTNKFFVSLLMIHSVLEQLSFDFVKLDKVVNIKCILFCYAIGVSVRIFIELLKDAQHRVQVRIWCEELDKKNDFN